jgi:hypothetical protein
MAKRKGQMDESVPPADDAAAADAESAGPERTRRQRRTGEVERAASHDPWLFLRINDEEVVAEYRGIAFFSFESAVHSNGFTAIAMVEGEPELWHVRDAEATAELRRYFRDRYGDVLAIPIVVLSTIHSV